LRYFVNRTNTLLQHCRSSVGFHLWMILPPLLLSHPQFSRWSSSNFPANGWFLHKLASKKPKSGYRPSLFSRKFATKTVRAAFRPKNRICPRFGVQKCPPCWFCSGKSANQAEILQLLAKKHVSLYKYKRWAGVKPGAPTCTWERGPKTDRSIVHRLRSEHRQVSCTKNHPNSPKAESVTTVIRIQ